MNDWMILKIGFRNVWLQTMRSLIVGLILAFGAFLAVLGHSFVDGIANGMKNSVTQSISGDIQIYNDHAKEKLSVFGNMDGSPSDIGHINNFADVARKLEGLSEVSAVVPMGTSSAMLNPGNILDFYLEKLRKDFKNPNHGDLQSQKQRIRFLVQEIQSNLNGRFDEIGLLSASDVEAAKINLGVVNSDPFWKDFDVNYENKIEFLANKIAPLIFDDNLFMFSYVGTDPQKFQKYFPQFEIVKGQMIPPGERGFLIHDFIYENFVKHRIARRLDDVKKKMKELHTTIAASKELQDAIKANVEQSAEIYLQLGPGETQALREKLQKLLSDNRPDFRDLLKKYLSMTDDDFAQRYDFFYREIAPHVILYKVGVGEVLPLNAFTKSGSSTSINVKVFGTFRFKSFENSPLAGNFNLMDLVSLRELYGFMTDERRKQNQELESEMGLKDVGRDNINDMFKEPTAVDSAKSKVKLDVPLEFVKRKIGANYTQDEMDNGVFLHAAVFLKNPRYLQSTIDQINALSKSEGLGVQAVSWQDAAGFIGQMTFLMKALLNLFIGIALLLASLMITNSLLMAAMNRKQEIGTMRAIGASTGFVYKLFFYETAILSLIFGGLGAGVASLVVFYISKVGIPASGDVMFFFFSGPRLYLHLNFWLVLIVVLATTLIAVLATQYPAWKAMQISPLQAMQKRE